MPSSKDYLNMLSSGQSAQDENLYGFIPGGWLPDWVKQGYNQSIEGMAQQVIQGKPVFKVDQDYDPNMMEDVLSTVVSFLTPTDIAAMALGGGIGGAAIKKIAVNKIVKSGGRKGLAKAVVNNSFKKVTEQAKLKAITGATGLGFYSGLQSSLGQEVNTGDVDAVKTLKDTAIGATLGGLTGGLGTRAKQIAQAKGLGVKQAFAVEKGSEVGVFGTAGPLLEGELPSAESYIHAAGVIGGLTISRGMAKGLIKPSRKELKGAELEKKLAESAEALSLENARELRGKEVWTNKKGEEVKILTDWTSSRRNDVMLELQNVTTGEKFSRSKKDFFQKERWFRKTDSAGKSVSLKMRNKFFKMAKELGMTDLEMKAEVDRALGGETKLRKHSKKGREYHTEYGKLDNVGKGGYEQRRRLNEQLEAKLYVKNKISDWKSQGVIIKEASGESLIKKALSPEYYDKLMEIKAPITDFLKTREARIGSDPLAKDGINMIFGMQANTELLNSRMFTLFDNAKYTTKDGKVVKGLHKLKKAQREELAESLDSHESSDVNRVRDYRRILTASYNMAKKEGIDVAPFEQNYFPLVIRSKIFRTLRDDLYKIIPKDERLLGGSLKDVKGLNERLKIAIDNLELSPDSIEALKHVRGILEKQKKRKIKYSEAFQSMRDEVFSEYVYQNKSIEIARSKKRLPNKFYERDAGVVLTDYASNLSKKIGFVKSAGKKGEKIYNTINAMHTKGLHSEAGLLRGALDIYTGKIELDRKFNWNPRTKNILNDIVNFQVGTKIGLGLAVVPNFTQVFVSSVLKAGYAPFFRGTYKYLSDNKYRNRIKKYSGAGSLQLHNIIMDYRPKDITLLSRFADLTTKGIPIPGTKKGLGFTGINRVNSVISAYTGYEAALKWQNIAKTSKYKARRDWAMSNLKDMGVTDVNKRLTHRNMARAMYEFSRDTQLQKNVFRDPVIANDPRFRPFFLFKRFGYRQAEWIGREFKKEVIDNKNAAFALRLAAGGMIGGTLVNGTRRMIGDFVSGLDIFDEQYRIGDDDFGLNDVMDNFQAVGAFGLISDIVASESTWRSLDFAVKPAILQDANKAYITLQKIMKDTEDFGLGFHVGQRALRNIAPVFGTIPRRFMERQFETTGQRESYVKFRYSKIHPRILDYMVDGNDRMAQRLIREWNKSFPERPIMYDDIGPKAINRRLKNKYEKRMNP